MEFIFIKIQPIAMEVRDFKGGKSLQKLSGKEHVDHAELKVGLEDGYAF